MDLEILHHCQNLIPKVNHDIAEGWSWKQMDHADMFIHKILQAAFVPLNQIGLFYRGYETLTPYEQLRAISRPYKNNNKRSIEITPTSARAIQCNLKFKDQITGAESIFRRNLMIPFLERGNILTNRGSKYIVSPTLSDQVFSLEDGNIFTTISRAKITFIRTPYWFVEDGHDIQIDVQRAQLYKDKQGSTTPQTNKTNAHVPTLVNYLLCMHGLSGMFSELYNTEVKYGREKEINDKDFPEDDWVICKSKGTRTRGRAAKGGRSEVCIAIPREKYSRELQHIVAALFYILDHRINCPGLTMTQLDSVDGWKRALASFALVGEDIASGLDKIESHLKSVSYYMDNITINKMQSEGLNIRTLLELFKYIIANFSVIACTIDASSLENKVLTVLPNVLYGLTSSIFRMMFEIQKQAKGRISKSQLDKLLTNKLWKDDAALIGITGHSEISSLDSATDVLLLKCTSLMVPQIKKGAGSKTTMSEINNPAFKLHWGQGGVTTYQMVNKSCPTARNRINCFAVVDEQGRLQPHPDAVPVIKNIKTLMDNTNGM